MEESAQQNMQDFGAHGIANTLNNMAKQRYKATGPRLLALEQLPGCCKHAVGVCDDEEKAGRADDGAAGAAGGGDI
jgi:hypothetical protein